MRIPNQVHLDQPWRIHELVPDFRLEDVWRYPGVRGSEADFDRVVARATSGDGRSSLDGAARVLWRVRDALGRWFGLGELTAVVDPPDGVRELLARVPEDLRGTGDAMRFSRLPFVPLYRAPREYAAALSNRTVDAVMHLGWVADRGDYAYQLAVYVRPRGPLGSAYMAFIKPFRYLIIYPSLERNITRGWHEQTT